MERPDLFKEKKNKKKGLNKELDVDLDSDLPVHEEFVDEKGVRKARKKEEDDEE